jgi:hypothetical protein
MSTHKGDVAFWANTYQGMKVIDPATPLGDWVFGYFGNETPHPSEEVFRIELGSILVASEASCAFDPEQIGIPRGEVSRYQVPALLTPYYVAKTALTHIKDRLTA